MQSPHKNKLLFSFFLALSILLVLGVSLSLRYIQSNALSFQTNTTWTSGNSGNWSTTTTWGLHSTTTTMLNPASTALDNFGNIYVSDGNGGGNHRIVVLSPDGTASTTIGGTGSALETQLGGQISPTGIAVSTSTGKVYILDWPNNRVVVVNPNGSLFATYTAADISAPMSIALSYNGTMYITNQSNNKIAILNPNGTASTSINFSGGPTDIAVSGDGGKIYLSNADSNQIKVLNPNGSVFASYSGVPNSIEVTANGTIYTTYTDTNNGNGYLNYIAILNPDGSASTTFPVTLSGGGPNNAFHGISVSSSGKIYLASIHAPGQVMVLNPDGTQYAVYGGLDLPAAFSGTEGIDYPGINDTVHIDRGTVTLSLDTNVKTLNLYSGATLNLNGHTLTIAADGGIINTGGTIILNGGHIKYLGAWTTATSGPWAATSTWGINSATLIEGTDYPGPNDTVFINTGTTTLSQNQNVKNITLDQGGALNLAGHTLNVSGNWTTSGGIMKTNPGNEGTVNFNSNNTQDITGTSTFENLTKVVSQNSGLRFGTDTTINVTNNITLGGALGHLLTIAPTGFIPPQFVSSISVPGALAVTKDSNGNLFVLDKTTHIKKYDANDVFVSDFGPSGTGLGQFNTSVLQGSITTDSNDNIIATNWATFIAFGWVPTIEKFAPDLTPLLHFGSYGTGDGQFNTFPGGVAVDSHDNIFVGDNNNRIQKFDSNGNYTSQFGSYGTANGQFALPWGLTFDANDNLYVVDANNTRIQKFDSNNNFLWKIGSTGSLNSQFSNLYGGIALDPAGYLYVTDTGGTGGANNRVQIFNSDGTYKSQFGSLGSGNSQFSHPQGIFVDTSNNIYIADTGNNRVVKYSYTTFPNFNIIHSSSTSGTVSLNYLSVAGSTNQSTSTFTCNNCFNAGNNINWTIPLPPRHVVQQASSTATSTTQVATSTATSTTQVATSTASTTPVVPPVQPVITKGKTKAPAAATSSASNTITSTSLANVGTTTASTTVVSTTVSNASSSASTQGIVSSITDSIQGGIAASAPLKSVSDAVNSSVGSAVTKTIATTGVVAGASAAISAVAFANPITFAEIWLIPTRIFGLFVGALGVRRKNRPWGTVYDSVTKRPIDPAYVSLMDVRTGKEVATAITDLDGRYSFSVLPGTYKIIAQKTNYSPSTKMMGQTFDEVYKDLYFGTEIVIEHEGEVITKNIPMDPQGFDWNEFTKNKMNVNTFIKERDITWAKISKLIFVVGFLVSVVGLIFSPAPYNFIIAIFYIVAYTLNFFVFKVKRAGSIIEKATNNPLSFAIVKIFREGETEPMVKKIADKFGNYYSLVPKGRYMIEVDKKNNDSTYSEVFKSELLNITNGVVNLDVKV